MLKSQCRRGSVVQPTDTTHKPAAKRQTLGSFFYARTVRADGIREWTLYRLSPPLTICSTRRRQTLRIVLQALLELRPTHPEKSEPYLSLDQKIQLRDYVLAHPPI